MKRRGAADPGTAGEGSGVGVRPALPSEAVLIERLMHVSSAGFTRYLWSRLSPGEDPRAVGARNVMRDEGAVSWRSVTLAEIGGAVAGMLMTSRLTGPPEAVEDLPAILRPQWGLRARAVGAQHVTFLATLPRFRRRGAGWALLGEAERMTVGATGVSLIVSDRNAGALRLYRSFGFREIAEAPAVKEGWRSATKAWVLMLKPVDAPG